MFVAEKILLMSTRQQVLASLFCTARTKKLEGGEKSLCCPTPNLGVVLEDSDSCSRIPGVSGIGFFARSLGVPTTVVRYNGRPQECSQALVAARRRPNEAKRGIGVDVPSRVKRPLVLPFAICTEKLYSHRGGGEICFQNLAVFSTS